MFYLYIPGFSVNIWMIILYITKNPKIIPDINIHSFIVFRYDCVVQMLTIIKIQLTNIAINIVNGVICDIFLLFDFIYYF